MAKINKLQKSGVTIYPATIPQAVIDSETGKTQKEVNDDLAQLESDVEQLAYVKIKNEAVNGNFENGLISPFFKNDGSVVESTLAINSSTPISGNYDIRFTIITPGSSGRPTFFGLNRAGNIGDKIYLHFYAKILSGTPMIESINNGDGVSTIYGGDVIDGRNTRIIDVVGTGNVGTIYFNSMSAWDMQMDNFMRINLTETFGAGNEPTEEEMDLLISTLGIDYFEGEITIPAQKVIQWLLESPHQREREIIRDLNNKVNVSNSKNLLDPNEITERWISSNGNISTSNTMMLSGAIPIKRGQTLNVLYTNGVNGYNALFRKVDDVKAIEGTVVSGSSSTITNNLDEDVFARFTLIKGLPYYEVTDIADVYNPFEYFNPISSYIKNEIDSGVSRILDFDDLTLVGSVRGVQTYNRSEYIKVSKGAIIKLWGQATSDTVCKVYNNNKENVQDIGSSDRNQSSIDKVNQDGYVVFQSFNETRPEYDPDYPFIATISYNKDSSSTDTSNTGNQTTLLNFTRKSFGNTMAIKAFKELNYTDGTLPMWGSILWNDTLSDEFFISDSKFSEKVRIFEWDKSFADGVDSGMYSAIVMPNGDILFVYRTEFHGGDIPDDNNRRNPIIYEAANNFKPKEIDFGSQLKPTGWLQNVGVHYSYRYDKLFIAEYTRGNVEKARVWAVDMPVTDPSNWVVKIEKDITVPYGNGFKHFHTAQGDPFNPVLYATSGDGNESSGVWASVDGGVSFSMIDDYNQAKYRMLNMVFTKDYIFWASDQWTPNHILWRATRDENGVLDASTITQVLAFVDEGTEGMTTQVATYATVYLECYNALLFLDRCDNASSPALPVRLYDIDTDTLHELDFIKNVDYYSFGFRCEAVTIYPKGNRVTACFGKNYGNRMVLLGNKRSEPINTFDLIITKNGDSYDVTYETIF